MGSQQQRIKAIVDFFGGLSDYFIERLTQLAPVLILHGEADKIVPVSEAHKVARTLEQRGLPYEMKLYKNAGHGFHGLEMLDAAQRAYKFLKKHLGNRPNRLSGDAHKEMLLNSPELLKGLGSMWRLFLIAVLFALPTLAWCEDADAADPQFIVHQALSRYLKDAYDAEIEKQVRVLGDAASVAFTKEIGNRRMTLDRHRELLVPGPRGFCHAARNPEPA